VDKENQNSLKLYLRLLEYIKPLWFYFVLSFIGYIAFAATQAGYAHLIKYFIEALQGESDELIYLVPAGAVVLAVLRAMGSFVGGYYMSKVGQHVVHTLRCEMFDRMVKFPCTVFDNNKAGRLINRITGNVGKVTGAVTSAITIIVREGMTIIFLMGYLVWVNWKLTLVFVVIAPLIALVVVWAGKRLRALSHKAQEAAGEITHILGETINGYRVMRSYGGEEYEKERFRKASKEGLRQGIKMQRTTGISTPLIQLLVVGALAVVMYLVLSLREIEEVGTLLAYVVAAGLIPKPMRQLSEVYGTVQKALAACERIFQHLDEGVEKDKGLVKEGCIAGAVSIQNVCFKYDKGRDLILNKVSLEIKKGQSVGLVGQSGSGKSTLASLIPRFYEYDEGTIKIDNIEIKDFQLKYLRKNISLVTQNVTLFNDTIANNIAYGDLDGYSRGAIEKAAEMAYAKEFILKLPNGFDTQIGDNGVKLSGGQRQRLSIARAILKDAPILVLDEATSALDTESEMQIQRALEMVMKNRTTLVIAHRLSTIKSVDKIVVLEQGEIIEEGSHDDLLDIGGAYSLFHKLQFQK